MATDRTGRKSPGTSGSRGKKRSSASKASRGAGADAEDDAIDAEFGEDLDDESGSGERTKAIPDLFRRAMAVGLSGFFSTEETFRRALGDTLPKDWIDFVNEQSERTRSELIERMSSELGRVIQQVDVAELLAALMKGQTLEIDARIRLVADEDGGDPAERVRLRVSGKRDERD